MKHKIAIIICYFGSFPSIYPLWIRSCKNNPLFNYLIFTDINEIKTQNNIIVHHCTLGEISDLAQRKLYGDICILSAYKLCDFKPMYGIMFEDYLKGYDFWGICDMDMVFGDLSLFITDAILQKYEKVYQLGHLTLYRNTEEVNNRFKMKGYIDWEVAVTSQKHCKMCERGMIKKYSLSGIQVYTATDYADISKIHRRYQLSHWLIPKKNQDRFAHQLFYYENGHVYRAVYHQERVFVQEFNYIHLQKRRLEVPNDLSDCFYITKNTFINKSPGIPSAEEIITLNPYPGRFYELWECVKYEIKTKTLIKQIVSRVKLRLAGKP